MANLNNSEIYSMYTESPRESHKWESYFYIYEELFGNYRNKEITFVEVGVHNGGSLYMWRKYFGDDARIIGIDLNPVTKKLEKEGFEIYIGNQNDPQFWKKFFNDVKNIDILLDDGSHLYFDQLTTLKETLPFVNNSGIIVIEDTHTSYIKKFGYKTTKTTMDFTGKLINNLHKKHPHTQLNKKENIYDSIYKITSYESITAYHIDEEHNMLNKPTMNNNKGIGGEDFRFNEESIGKILQKIKNLEGFLYSKKRSLLIKILLRLNYLAEKIIYKIYNFINKSKINKFFKMI